MKKRPLLTAPSPAPTATLPEARDPEMLDLIRREQPTSARALASLRPHPRPSRPLAARHVIDMARSIAALGLIHPIVIDIEDVVIAGSHRHAALRILAAPVDERALLLSLMCRVRSSDVDSLKQRLAALPATTMQIDMLAVPVRVMPLSIAADPDGAWQVEVAENERRRDYSAPEVRGLAERLRAQGYRMESGRPRNGEVAGMPLLTAIIGRSESTVRRLLAAETQSLARDPVEEDRQAAVKALSRYKTRQAEALTSDQHRILDRALRLLDSLAR